MNQDTTTLPSPPLRVTRLEELAFGRNTDTGLLAMNGTGFDYGSHLVVRVAEVEVE